MYPNLRVRMENSSFTLNRKWRWQSFVIDTRLDTFHTNKNIQLDLQQRATDILLLFVNLVTTEQLNFMHMRLKTLLPYSFFVINKLQILTTMIVCQGMARLVVCGCGWLHATVGRRSVFDRRTFPVLRSTCSWRVTYVTADVMWVNRPL